MLSRLTQLMPEVKCKIISKPEDGTRAVLYRGNETNEFFPFIKGNGPTTYICGLCRTIIVETVYHGQIRNLVFVCQKCKSYNEIP